MNQHIDLSDLDINELEMRLELAAGDPTAGPGAPTTDVTVGVGYGWSF
jgi:hypothetical protein